jgi:threonine dehydrogenase-like Zn-dependent dehydrogenase
MEEMVPDGVVSRRWGQSGRGGERRSLGSGFECGLCRHEVAGSGVAVGRMVRGGAGGDWSSRPSLLRCHCYRCLEQPADVCVAKVMSRRLKTRIV